VNLNGIVAHKPEMFQYEYARTALQRGLKFEAQLGVNPFKFGMIGSTDSHVGLSAVEEDNYFGKVALLEPNPHRFYYARVIEIPTPRWTAYDAKRFGITMDPTVPMTAQERAYTSPIWYTPAK
jgi:hypothetical protein